MLQSNKAIVLLMAIMLSGLAHAESAPLCMPDLKSPYPFATPAGAQRNLDKTGTRPADVFHHVQSLKATIKKLGIDSNANVRPKLPLQNVLPRHNYVLAYDLLVLLQLWHQDQKQIAHLIPSFHYPQTIIPAHVFAWIDASLALAHCFLAQDSATLDISAAPEHSDSITPRDVYFELDRLVHALANQISGKLRSALQNMRLNQIFYYLQDILMARGHNQLVGWQEGQPLQTSQEFVSNEPHIIATQILAKLDKLNDRPSLLIGTDVLNHAPEARSQLLTFLLSLIFGELQNWSLSQGFGKPPPPLVPVVQNQINQHAMAPRLAQVLVWLDDIDTRPMASINPRRTHRD